MIRSLSQTVLPALTLALSCSVGCIVPVYFTTDQAAGSATGTGGAGGAGGGGVCTPGETKPCYDGPEGTEGKGICKAGVQTCFPDGSSWLSCSGAIKPAIENCATPEDEDCDGLAPPCEGNCLWSKRFGDLAYQSASGLTMDKDGNVIVTGVIKGQTDFGGGALLSAGDWDVFLAKLGPNGDHLWSRSFGDGDAQIAFGVAVDGEDNVLVAGNISGQADFGGGPLLSAGSKDIFLAKFDHDGGHAWSKLFGDAETQDAASVAVDGAGNVLVTGGVEGQINFGGETLTSKGGFDIFVAKFDSAGSHLWSKLFGDSASQAASGIGVDSAGNVLVTGYIQGQADFGGGALTSAGGEDIFIAKLGPNGDHVWSRIFGDASHQRATSLAVDGSDNLIVAGYIYGPTDFGGGALSGLSGDTNGDAFLAKFDTTGAHLWSKRFNGVLFQEASAVAVDQSGNVLVTGYIQGQADFGGGPIASAGGLGDVFLAKFNPAGNHLWSKRFGDATNQAGRSVALDGAGNVLVTGFVEGQTDFGCGPIDSAGQQDIFVAKFTP